MQIIVTGSLAYDRIMTFQGYFADHILPDKLHVLNVCFQVEGITEKFGGTAGNITYALTLMGDKPIISAAIGHDYQRYFDWFTHIGISTDHIRIVPEEFTAGAYITTDRADNQITGFNPGAMKYSSCLDFDALDPGRTMLIVSPGNLNDMTNYPIACKAKGIDYIFDPGQSLPMLDAHDLMQAMDGAHILICNDYELDLIMNKTGLCLSDLQTLSRSIIVTLGETGSRIITGGVEIHIPACQAAQVLDPTGAGDSYRGGLLSGLMRGLDLVQSARLGSVCASFSVESYGTQTYAFTAEEFQARLTGC